MSPDFHTTPSLPNDEPAAAKPDINKPNRRRWLTTARNGFLLGSGLLGWTVFIEPHWLTVEHRILLIPHLPASWTGKRLVQISDLHVGAVGESYLMEAARRVNELQPDVLVVTGDFINHDFPMMDERLEAVLGAFKPGKTATFGCLGNHDYGRGWVNQKTAARVVDVAKQAGIEILRDESVSLNELEFYGLDDYWTPNFEAKKVLTQARTDRAAICLCHNPDVCDEPVWGRFTGVILSGHTHGGQCKPPFLPAPMTPIRNKRYQQGFVELANQNTLFVNRGLGYTRRVRFNCRPEITVFEMQAAVVNT